jgi:hypothetical protein
MKSLLTLITASQLKVSLFFAALLWLYAAVDGNFYLMILLPWIVFIVATTWKSANPGVAIFDEKDEEEAPAKKEEKAEPVAASTEA